MATRRQSRGKGLLAAGVAVLGWVPGGPLLAADVDWSRAETVTIQLLENRFVPNQLRFRLGVAYRLHLENNGTAMHEFTAPQFFRQVEIRNPEVLVAGDHEVLLQPNERKDLFFVAHKAGRYELTCADHDWDGMSGEIIVE